MGGYAVKEEAIFPWSVLSWRQKKIIFAAFLFFSSSSCTLPLPCVWSCLLLFFLLSFHIPTFHHGYRKEGGHS